MLKQKTYQKKKLSNWTASFITINPFQNIFNYGNALIKLSNAGCVIGLKLEITSI